MERISFKEIVKTPLCRPCRHNQINQEIGPDQKGYDFFQLCPEYPGYYTKTTTAHPCLRSIHNLVD